jgi:hypothetical protein
MSMRIFVGALAALGAGAACLALADPSATPPATEAAPVTAPAPAAPAAPAAKPTAAVQAPKAEEVDPFEKHLMAEGYRPEMQGGEKVYCRKEAPLGSRLSGQKSCGSAEQWKLREDQTKEGVSKAQRAAVNPKGS